MTVVDFMNTISNEVLKDDPSDNRTRVQKRQQATKERIFQATMMLVRKKGFENTTIAEIAEAADIGKGTFFTYYPTKEAVFGHLGETLTACMTKVIENGLSAGGPIESLIESCFHASAEWHEQNRGLSEQVVMATMRSSLILDADAANQKRLTGLLRQLIQTGQARGEFRKELGVDDGAAVLTGIYFSTLMDWLRAAGETRTLKERFTASLQFVLRGIRA